MAQNSTLVIIGNPPDSRNPYHAGLIQCEFTGNASTTGGGAITGLLNLELDLVECTIEDNAGDVAGGLYLLSGTNVVTTVANSAICDNTIDNIDGDYIDAGGNQICPDNLDSDINGDGVIDGADLGLLLAEWDKFISASDLNNDLKVDGADLGILLADWTS